MRGKQLITNALMTMLCAQILLFLAPPCPSCYCMKKTSLGFIFFSWAQQDIDIRQYALLIHRADMQIVYLICI